MSTAATLAEARRRLTFVDSVLTLLQRAGADGVPAHERGEVYRNTLVQAAQVIGCITDAQHAEGADRLWRELHPEPLRVYLCAAFSRQTEMATYAAVLRSLGVRVIARWLDAPVDDLGNPAAMREAAIECCEDIAQVDTVLAFTEPRGSAYWTGGRHVEVGYALALRRRVVTIGPLENVFHAHPGVTNVETFADALPVLGFGHTTSQVTALGAAS